MVVRVFFFFFFWSFCIFCPEFSLTEHESSYFSSPTSPLCFETDAEAEAPILWLPGVKNLLIGRDPDAGKDRRQEEKGTTEGEMVKSHHWCNGPEFEQAPGDGEGQGHLACCSPRDRKESEKT